MDKIIKIREIKKSFNRKFVIYKSYHKNKPCYEVRLFKRVLFFWVEDAMNNSPTNNCYRCRNMENVNNFIKNYSMN